MKRYFLFQIGLFGRGLQVVVSTGSHWVTPFLFKTTRFLFFENIYLPQRINHRQRHTQTDPNNQYMYVVSGWGCFYLFTFGGLGIGWLIDLCRIPSLVKDANKDAKELQANIADAQNTLQIPPNARVVRIPAEAYIVYPEDGSAPGTLHVSHPQVFSTSELFILNII